MLKSQAFAPALPGLASGSLVLVGTALCRPPVSRFGSFLDDPWLPSALFADAPLATPSVSARLSSVPLRLLLGLQGFADFS